MFKEIFEAKIGMNKVKKLLVTEFSNTKLIGQTRKSKASGYTLSHGRSVNVFEVGKVIVVAYQSSGGDVYVSVFSDKPSDTDMSKYQGVPYNTDTKDLEKKRVAFFQNRDYSDEALIDSIKKA